MTKKYETEEVPVEVFIGRMVQHILPKGFKRVRYYGLQATKTFAKWKEMITKGIKNLSTEIHDAYQVITIPKYRERYIKGSGKDPFKCSHCGNEMVLWRIWHPKYGVIYDEREGVGKERSVA